MATSAQWFGQAGGNLIARLWVPQQMGIALMKDTYVPNRDTQMRYADVAAEELAAGGGYAVGGLEITGRNTSYDAPSDEWTLLGADVSWGPGAAFQTRYGIVYEMATTDKFLWELLDFGQVIPVNGYFVVDFASGVLGVKAGPAV
jgi:hypothetical protein